MNDAHAVSHVLLVLAALLATAKLLGAFAQRIGQPAVLGELIAGILLGRSVLGLLDPGEPVIHVISQLGVIVLLFEIGLQTELRSIAKVAGTATVVALVGVILPFALGYAVISGLLGLDRIPALVCGAALTATSVGISARVLSDLGLLSSREGQVVLGAAVIDDVVGLIVLSVVGGIVSGGGWTIGGVARTTGIAVGFLAVTIIGGKVLARPIFKTLGTVRAPGTLGVVALAFAFALSALAATSGSAMILGAFSAGLILNGTPGRFEIERVVTTIGYFLVPIFFASVGAAVQLSAFTDTRILMVALLLIVVGVIGKFAAAYAPWTFRGNKKLIGIAMIPRGEVGLIFAQMGLATQAISPPLYSAITLMVLVTTFLAPPLLSRAAPRRNEEGTVDASGIDNLVAGDWHS